MGDSIAERMDAGWQAARHWETECEAARNQLAAVTAERDALAAQLAALKKRVADAPRAMAHLPWNKDRKNSFITEHTVGSPGTYALVRLEDEE